MATKENTSSTTDRLENIAGDLNRFAARLAGISSIAKMVADYGDNGSGNSDGDSPHALAALADSISDSLSDSASQLVKIGEEGGAA